jgi:hypothetical protein
VASPLIANVYLHYVFDLWADALLSKTADAVCPEKCLRRLIRS